MTVPVGKVLGWLALWCMGCGGNAVTTKPDPATPQGGAAHTAGAGGTGSLSGTSNLAGEGPSEPLSCTGVPPICMQSCGSLERTDAICIDLRYFCPDGSVELDSCPPEACARRAKNCCSPSGQVAFPECAADGAIGSCPDGFAQQDTCLPQGVGIQSCLELKSGAACPATGFVCYTSKCGYNCECQPNDAGALTWQCSALPC